MSSNAFRRGFEVDLKAFLATLTPSPVFYDTINLDNDPTDNLWVTVEYFAAYAQKLSTCTNEYRGAVDVYVFGKAGEGYDTVNKIADAIEGHFNSWDLSTVNAQIIGSSMPESLGGDSRFYAEVVNFDYSLFE